MLSSKTVLRLPQSAARQSVSLPSPSWASGCMRRTSASSVASLLHKQCYGFNVRGMGKHVDKGHFRHFVTVFFKNKQVPCKCLWIAGDIEYLFNIIGYYVHKSLFHYTLSWRIKNYDVGLFGNYFKSVSHVPCIKIAV